MIKIQLSPTPSGLWQVDGLSQIARRTKELESSNWPEAAEMRFDAVQALLYKIGAEELALDWNHAPTRSAMELLYSAAADQLAIGEVEMAVALWESLAALDEEDHMSVSVPLAFCYVDLQDYDCLEEVMFDISPKTPEYHLLQLWSEFRRTGGIDRDALRTLRTRHKAWMEEFSADQHPADEAYMADCRSERPSPQTEARELWFATAPLWEHNPDFLQTLKKA